MEKNKIKFGLKNVHYSVITETTESGKTTSSYGTVKPWPGAVSISFGAEGEQNNFYADDSVYEVLNTNSGYSGDYESALIPEDVYVDVLGHKEDSNGVIVETNNDQQHYIALMFEFDGDKSGRRYCFYKCSLTRPDVASKTKENTTEPQTDKVKITMVPRPDDGRVRIFTGSKTSKEAYDNWYTKVYESPAEDSIV